MNNFLHSIIKTILCLPALLLLYTMYNAYTLTSSFVVLLLAFLLILFVILVFNYNKEKSTKLLKSITIILGILVYGGVIILFLSILALRFGSDF